MRALEQLFALGALNDNGTLNDIGRRMAELPLDPTYAKVLFQAEVSLLMIIAISACFNCNHILA
jgi:HrpA-like RNA helicase